MEQDSLFFHKPVLVDEVLHYLAIKPGGTYLDVTFGSGGHTRAILSADPTVKVIAFDWDNTSLETYGPLIEQDFPDRVTFIWGNFSHMYKLLKKEKISKVDGILADFGTSQMQINFKDGFSIYKDTPLDMRMAPGHFPTNAAHVINSATLKELCTIFWDYGEERHASTIAKAIIAARGKKKIKTTAELAAIVTKVVRFDKAKRIHPATRIFQALRIYVNHELENIQSFLAVAPDYLNESGRLVCISFHSLEDRLVKESFAQKERELVGVVITKKIVTATEKELAANASARSAKLRAFERKIVQ